jgi:hypothetical protein
MASSGKPGAGGVINEWLQEIRAFLKSKWGKPVLGLALVGAVLYLAYHVLIVLPERQAQHARSLERQEKEWLLMREPVPKEDPSLEQRNLAWDEITRKQLNPDYEIPPYGLQLIKQHWADLTSGWTPDQVETLQKRLGLDGAGLPLAAKNSSTPNSPNNPPGKKRPAGKTPSARPSPGSVPPAPRE